MTLRMTLLAVFAAISLSGCAAISALDDAARSLEIYELRTPDIESGATRPRDVEVVVEEPVASGALATERIMIRPAPLQAQYLPEIRWADQAPVMLQTLLIRSLAETGALASVGRSPVGSIADYAVLGELTDFQAEAAGEAAVVRLRIMLRIVRERDSRVVASRTFAATEDVPSTDPGPVVRAFDTASTRLLSEIVPWVLAQVGAGR